MIKTVTMYTIICDNCGRDSAEGSEYSCWNEEDFAWDTANEDGWEEHEGKHYCPDCFDCDEEDNLIIKPSTKEP